MHRQLWHLEPKFLVSYCTSLSPVKEGGRSLVGLFFSGAQGTAVEVPTAGGWAQRVAAAQIALSTTASCLVVCVYGRSNPTAVQVQELDEQVMLLLRHHAEGGRGPMVIMGDFNLTEAQLPSLQLCRRAGWRDLCTEGTCLTANSAEARRIDMVWASSSFAGRVGNAEVDWSYGFPVHAAQHFQVMTGAARVLPRWQLGDAGPEDGEASFDNCDWEHQFDGVRGAWQEALRNRDVDGAWAALETALVRSHQLQAPEFQLPRGRTVERAEEAPQDKYTGQAYTQALRDAQHRKRVLQQLLACVEKPERGEMRKQLRHVLCKDPRPEWASWGMLELPKGVLQHLVDEARKLEDAALAEAKASRRESWRKWCQAEASGGMRQLYRFVKQGPASMMRLGMTQDGEGVVRAGKAALLHASEAAWWPLWQPAPERRTRTPEFIRYEPLPILPVSASQLARVAWKCPAGKAPGMDGWSIRRMWQWPTEVWQRIAEFLRLVEKLGRWPCALRRGLICLLPKNGVQASAQNPLEARPVVLLAQVYRLWAAYRAADLAKWIHHHGLQPVGTERVAAAEELALLAAGLLEQATSVGQDAALLAMDLSKAYDRVPLEVLEELVRNSGMAAAIGEPMLDMARGPRRIKVLDVVGSLRQPSSGLIPGCPMATFVMSLLLLRWRQGVEAPVGGGLRPRLVRCWVDDSTAGDVGTQESVTTVIKGLRRMELLAASDGLVVNQTKSAVAATPASHREDLTLLLQARQRWARGLLMITHDDEVTEEVKGALLDVLGVGEDRAVTCGAESLRWQVAGGATVLVHLPGQGVPPSTTAVVAAGQGVVLRGAPAAWSQAQLEEAKKAMREHSWWPRAEVPVVAALKDLGVAVGTSKIGKDLHQGRLRELVRRTGLLPGLERPLHEGNASWPVRLCRRACVAVRHNLRTRTLSRLQGNM